MTTKVLSRQRLAQLERIARGKCRACGLRKLYRRERCRACFKRSYPQEMLRARERAGSDPWQPGRPGRPPKYT